MIDVLLLNPRTENKASEVRKLKSAVYKDNVIHQTEEKLREPPNGLLILASLLEARNFSVEIVDASILKNPFQYIRDNADRFRMIGIGSLTNTFNKAVQLAKTAKRYNPNLYLVMGGPHASFDYENILRNYPFVDLVCIGEAESTFPWIVEKLLLKSTIDMIYSDRDFAVSSTYNFPGRVQNILQDVDILPKGIAYLSKSFVDPFIKQLDLADGDTSLSTTVKDDGKLIATGFPDPIDLSALPLPARHLLDRKYFTANILVNRGCSNECSFCSRTNLFPEMRLRPLDHVFDEIKQILSYKNYEFVNFYDNINVNRAYFREFLDRLIRMDFPLPWGAEMRADAIKVEDATLLKKAGCKLVATGVESADKKVLKRNFKYQDPKKVATGIKNLKKAGIAIQAYFMIGLPGETPRSFRKTLKFLRNLPLENEVDTVNFFVTTPYPGSRLWFNQEDFKIDVIVHNYNLYDCQHPIMETESLDLGRIEHLIEEADSVSKELGF